MVEVDDRRLRLVGGRLAAIRRILGESGASGALLRARRNFAWATVGGENHVLQASDAGVAGLLVTHDAAAVFTAVNEAPRIADEEVRGLELEVHPLPWHDDTAMTREAERLAGPNILDDASIEKSLQPLRCVLSDVETDRMGWLAEQMTAAVGAALSATTPGMTEHAVAANACRELAADGIRCPVLLAAADERISRYRHPLPSAQRVEGRVMLVVVAERWGLHVAVTRFAEFRPLDPVLAHRMEAAAHVHDAMVIATRPGRTLGDVLAAGQAAYAADGYPEEWRLHHQGGIIGYQGRERIAVPGDDTMIQANMAFAWNPSVEGAKAEETTFLGDDGPHALTTDDIVTMDGQRRMAGPGSLDARRTPDASPSR